MLHKIQFIVFRINYPLFSILFSLLIQRPLFTQVWQI